ncbi:hypothetical protein [Dipodfec virus RodF1_47]|uniref:Uncharacterized protein n=1 Tax=Dipodfec virus RodF1_47 TaxID=2929298 RepID=A0A976N387_9VIRU|nr:hypothetical protein [Dipodfec virus RodF1_47]
MNYGNLLQLYKLLIEALYIVGNLEPPAEHFFASSLIELYDLLQKNCDTVYDLLLEKLYEE